MADRGGERVRPVRPDLDPRDLDIRAIVIFGIGLTALVLVASGLMWLASGLLRSWEQAKDPPPPILPEAQAPYEPPGPRLQIDPAAEMRALRAEEEAILTTYEWVDREAGIARIPIDRAIELMVEGAGE